MRSSKLSLVIAGAIAVAAVAAAVAVALMSLETPSPTRVVPADDADQLVDAGHAKPASTRTLAIYTRTEPVPSAHPERMRALLVRGKLPRGAVTATVLTDDDCAPDRNGVSHCRNQLKLPGGRIVTVRHPHRMTEVPCMTPGERVRLRRAVTA